MQSNRFAVVDVGSNTTKLQISEQVDTNFVVLLFKSYDLPLAPQTGIIQAVSVKHCIAALLGILELMEAYHVVQYKVVGTEALRTATNARSVLDEIASATGIHIAVLSQEEEARLTLAAVQIDMRESSLVCINGGGGSTEICWHRPISDDYAVLGLGARNMTDNYLLHVKGYSDTKQIIYLTIKKTLSEIGKSNMSQLGKMVCIGGSIWAAVMLLKRSAPHDFSTINRQNLHVEELEALAKQLIDEPTSFQGNKFAPDSSRMRILPAGILIQTCLARLLGFNEITISTRSISDALVQTFK